MKFYYRLLFQRTCVFNVLLLSGRLFHLFLCEIFLEVYSDWLSQPRNNQYKLRKSEYTQLCDFLIDSANYWNEINECTGKKEISNALNVRRLLVLFWVHIGSDRYMRWRIHDLIAISNSLGHSDIFITMTCDPYWPEIQNALLACQRANDIPDLFDRVFRMKSNFFWSIWKKTNLLENWMRFCLLLTSENGD